MNQITDRLQKFSEQKIGLDSKIVHLEHFNPRWKRIFSEEAYFIFDQLRDETLRLYHVGSTSIPGLDSKPIIDILGSVASLDELDQKKNRLEAIGYEYKGEFGIPGRRFCILHNPEKTIGYVHLHVFQHGHFEIEKHLRFRDYLRLSKTAKESYAQYKRYLCEELQISREKYQKAKNELIAKLTKDADNKKTEQKIFALLGAAEGHKNTLQFLQETYTRSSVEIVDLNDLSIAPYTYLNNPSDDFHTIIQKILAADLLVLATPVYWYAMSTSMKNFFDRLTNLLNGEFKDMGEMLYGKKVQLVSTGADLTLPYGFEVPFTGTAIYLGMDYMGALYKSVN